MNKARLEAFSDGVIAVIITIMVLEMKVPRGDELESLAPLVPVFLSYVLSFVYAGIYWSNHHHLFHAAEHVSGGILWANLHLLFWLSLIPFTTGWMNESHFHAIPVAAYGLVLLFSGLSFVILTRVLVVHHGRQSLLAKSIRGDRKGKISVAMYAIAIPLAFVNVWIACTIYAAVAAMWIVPDPRIEKSVA
ncbi:MAG: TMEM175 family protein [Usitatibacter sp.]